MVKIRQLASHVLSSLSLSYTSNAVLNLSNVQKVVNHWNKVIPYVKPFYAVKSHPNPMLLALLHSHNFGFDCASREEIRLAKEIPNSDIIFGNPTKSYDDIAFATKECVQEYVVDSIEEVQKIHNVNPSANYIIRTLAYEKDSAIRFNRKFGATAVEAREMLNYMWANRLFFSGYSYHVGSKCKSMVSHKMTIDAILREQQPMFERAEKYLSQPKLVRDIVDAGTEKARITARATMHDVRAAMGLNY